MCYLQVQYNKMEDKPPAYEPGPNAPLFQGGYEQGPQQHPPPPAGASGYPPQQPGAYPPQQPGPYPPQQPGAYPPPEQPKGYPPQGKLLYHESALEIIYAPILPTRGQLSLKPRQFSFLLYTSQKWC